MIQQHKRTWREVQRAIRDQALFTTLCSQFCIPDAGRLPGIAPCPRRLEPLPELRPAFLERIVHIELDRVRRHSETRDFIHLERDVGIDHVVAEDASAGEELTIPIEVLDGLIEA